MLREAMFAALIGLGLATPAVAQSFNRFYGFGDSTIDSGWYLSSPTGDPTVDALLPAAIAKGGGRATTNPGPINSQLLAGFFGLSAMPANQPDGTNYATGGARNAIVNTTGNLNAVPTVTQIANYLAATGGVADSNALYEIFSGGNDISAATGLAPALADSHVVTAAQALIGGIVQLEAAGARYIIVPNQPQSQGTAAQQSLRALYNTTLWTGLASAGISFIPADFNGMLNAVIANPTSFGLVPHSGPACNNFAGLATAWAILCTPDTLVSPDAELTHLFADDQHLTTAGQTIEADYYYSLITAPGEIALLAETPLLAQDMVIAAIENQIPISQRTTGARGFNAWVTGDLSSVAFDGSTGFGNLHVSPASVIAGIDYRVAPGALIGVAVSDGWEAPRFSLSGGFHQNDISGSIYGAFKAGPFWGEAIASYGSLVDSINRAVPIGITVQQNTGATDGNDASLALSGGYDFRSGAFIHGPYAGLTAQRVSIGGFTETGSFTSLGFGSQVRYSDVTSLGYQTSVDWGIWHPFARVEWDHEWAPLNRNVIATLTTIAAPSYVLPAPIFGRNWGSGTLGVSVDIAKGVVAALSLTGQAGQSDLGTYGGMASLSFAF